MDTEQDQSPPKPPAPPPLLKTAPPDERAPEPASAPAKPAITATQRDKEALAVAGKKTSYEPLRRLRYAKAFVMGTITDGLDGAAKWGNKAMWFGIGAGLILGICTGGLVVGAGGIVASVALGAVSGRVGGTVLGGGYGLATGGIRGVQRQQRAEKYADDLIVREKTKKPGAEETGIDYRDAYRAHQKRVTRMLDRVQLQEREIQQDSKQATWQERVHEGRGGGWGHSV